jgi:methionyl-tRNA formyltransferase
MDLLSTSDRLTVFTFREEPHEPPFLNDIREFSENKGATVHEAKRIGEMRWMQFWDSEPVDLMLAVNWRYLIPRHIFSRAKVGAYVFHDSLLPKYRGFSPTVWSIINGEDHTGVTLFEIDEIVDCGRIIAQTRIPIGPSATIDEISNQVTDSYIQLLENNIDALLAGSVSPRAQDEAAATYTCKLLPTDCQIDWRKRTVEIHNLIRGYTSPYPGAYTYLNGIVLRVWSAEPSDNDRHYVGNVPGRVVDIAPDTGVIVLTADGRILLKRVQLEGGTETTADKLIDSYATTFGRRGDVG